MARVSALIACALLIFAACATAMPTERHNGFLGALSGRSNPHHHLKKTAAGTASNPSKKRAPLAARKTPGSRAAAPFEPTDIYRLMEGLIGAVETRDFLAMELLLSDGFVAHLGCNWLSKQQWIDQIRANGVKSETITIRSYTESADIGVFALNVVGVTNGSTSATSSFSLDDIYVSIVPSLDRLQIGVMEEFQPMPQLNSTAMINAFMTVINASQDKQIAPWAAALSTNFVWRMFVPFDPNPPFSHNSTESLQILTFLFNNLNFQRFFVHRIFASCEMVIAEANWAAEFNDANQRAATNHITFGVRMDSNFKFLALDEFRSRPM